jgi:hypothetical protein
MIYERADCKVGPCFINGQIICDLYHTKIVLQLLFTL